MLKFLLSAKGIVLPVSTVELPLPGAGRCRAVTNRLHQSGGKWTTNFLRIFRILHRIRQISERKTTVKAVLTWGCVLIGVTGRGRSEGDFRAPGRESLAGKGNPAGQSAIHRRRTKYATTPSPSTRQPLSTEAIGRLNASTAHPASPPAATIFGAAPSSRRSVNAAAFATA